MQLLKKVIPAVSVIATVLFSTVSAYANTSVDRTFEASATWYTAPNGAKTASGETFDPQEMTAAHPSLPLGTIVKVTRESNNKSVFVKINDRCRCGLDLSKGAAEELNLVRDGRGQVEFEIYSESDAETLAFAENNLRSPYPFFKEETMFWRQIY